MALNLEEIVTKWKQARFQGIGAIQFLDLHIGYMAMKKHHPSHL